MLFIQSYCLIFDSRKGDWGCNTGEFSFSCKKLPVPSPLFKYEAVAISRCHQNGKRFRFDCCLPPTVSFLAVENLPGALPAPFPISRQKVAGAIPFSNMRLWRYRDVIKTENVSVLTAASRLLKIRSHLKWKEIRAETSIHHCFGVL